MIFQHGDIRVCQHARSKRFLHRMAGCVRRMDDAAAAVPAFACEVVAHAAGIIPGEGYTLIDQPTDGGFAMLDNVTRDGFIAQAGAGGEGILNVRIQRIVCGQHGGNAALRPVACAVQQGFFGDQSHLLAIGQLDGQRQASQAAADNQGVKLQQLGSKCVCSGSNYSRE